MKRIAIILVSAFALVATACATSEKCPAFQGSIDQNIEANV